jgi:hypothetical protein
MSEAKKDESDLSALLNAEALQGIANKVALHTPKGYVISLCIEDGAAWVDLGKDFEGSIQLPDSADKNLLEQLNDALCVANGWSI